MAAKKDGQKKGQCLGIDYWTKDEQAEPMPKWVIGMIVIYVAVIIFGIFS